MAQGHKYGACSVWIELTPRQMVFEACFLTLLHSKRQRRLIFHQWVIYPTKFGTRSQIRIALWGSNLEEIVFQPSSLTFYLNPRGALWKVFIVSWKAASLERSVWIELMRNNSVPLPLDCVTYSLKVKHSLDLAQDCWYWAFHKN